MDGNTGQSVGRLLRLFPPQANRQAVHAALLGPCIIARLGCSRLGLLAGEDLSQQSPGSTAAFVVKAGALGLLLDLLDFLRRKVLEQALQHLDLSSGPRSATLGRSHALAMVQTPEPLSFALVGCGLVAVGLLRRKCA